MKTLNASSRQSFPAFALTLLLVLLLGSPVSAQTVLLDLGDNFSTMTAQNWNTMIFNQAVPDLIDDTGAATGISFTPLFWGGDFQNSANWIEDTDWVLKEAATDHFGGFSVSFITFGNLNGVYKLEVVCSHPQTNHLTDITVNDQFSTGNFQNIPGVNGDDFDPEQDGRVAKNFLIWENVEAVNGQIELRVQKLAGTNAISVGALRLTRTGDAGSPSNVSATLTASPDNLPEPGGSVSFTARLDNSGGGSATITSLTHDVFGNLDGQGDCSMPQMVAENGGSYECTFTGNVTGNAGDSQVGTLTASGSDDIGAVNAQAMETVTLTDALPSAAVQVPSPSSVEEPGGTTNIFVEVSNTGVEPLTLTALNDSVEGDLDGQGNCSVPQTINPGTDYLCDFMTTVSGNAGDSQTHTVTATLSDDEANTTMPQDSGTVAVTDVAPTATVTKTASPASVDEPGGDVTFTIDVENTGSAESLSLTALVDDIHGDLNGQGDCSVPQTINAGAGYSCSFTVMVSGNGGDSETNTVTATLSDDDGNTITPEGSETVDINDLLPTANVTKSVVICGGFMEEPGGSFTMRVRVDNPGDEAFDIIDLFDDIYGDLDSLGDCSVPQTVAGGGSYSCSFSGTFNGSSGDSETSTVTVTIEDDEANQITPSDSATVHLEAAGSAIFAGCFENGDFSGWSQVNVGS